MNEAEVTPLHPDNAEARRDTGKPLYARFFGLKRAPFSIAPDPRYLYMSERHREALAHLLYGLKGGGGFVLLTGEIGAGKTTLCRSMLEQVPERCNVAYIFNPRLSVEELLETVCDEFGIPRADVGATVKTHVDALNLYLLRSHAVGQTNVLIIDEAQQLSAEVLDQLRLLTNLETSERKLLQIVLVGQPELRTLLAVPGMEQLAQRVIARYHLKALSAADTRQYVRHRLRVAGLRGPVPFERDAYKRIVLHSRGVARRINLLCDRALLGAYAEGKAMVSARIVDKAAVETFDLAPARSNGRRVAWAVAASAVVLTLAAALFAWVHGTHGKAHIAAPLVRQSTPASPPATQPVASKPVAAPQVVAPSAPLAPPEWLAAADLGGRFESSEGAALAALGRLWDLSLGQGDPCRAAVSESVLCYRDTNANAELIRRLGRPGILILYDDKGARSYALLRGLGVHAAILQDRDGGERRVALASLAPLWRGEFITLWRTPEGYVGAGPAASSEAFSAALSTRLANLARESPSEAGQPLDSSLHNAVAAFQLAHGLRPDGKPGPLTLMHLNHITGIDEPRLGKVD
ncbi:AAA family ATPase [Niveibacterium sp. SC-1]|uniref:ExeA family protein n=1 Tax=Niveibacterium sp. SC-1 TaxID=3135646 RepID=UPI00311E68F9